MEKPEIDVMTLDHSKTSRWCGLPVDEIRNISWLIQQDFPEAKTNLDFLYMKLRSQLIDIQKSCGLSKTGGVSSLDDESECDARLAVNQVDNAFYDGDEVELKYRPEFRRSMNPLEILINVERQAEVSARIDTLSPGDKARLELLDTCLHGKDFGEKAGVNLKKRHANDTIKKWIKEADIAFHQPRLIDEATLHTSNILELAGIGKKSKRTAKTVSNMVECKTQDALF